MRYQSTFADRIQAAGKEYVYYPLSKIQHAEKLPLSLKVLLENVLRNAQDDEQAKDLAQRIVGAGTAGKTGA